jgi:hypothetical protein
VSYKKQELPILGEHMGSLLFFFGEVSVAHLFNFLCCVFALFIFVLCLVYTMLPVSLDCPVLIAPSVFSNVYLCSSYNNINTYRPKNQTISSIYILTSSCIQRSVQVLILSEHNHSLEFTPSNYSYMPNSQHV